MEEVINLLSKRVILLPTYQQQKTTKITSHPPTSFSTSYTPKHHPQLLTFIETVNIGIKTAFIVNLKYYSQNQNTYVLDEINLHMMKIHENRLCSISGRLICIMLCKEIEWICVIR